MKRSHEEQEPVKRSHDIKKARIHRLRYETEDIPDRLVRNWGVAEDTRPMGSSMKW